MNIALSHVGQLFRCEQCRPKGNVLHTILRILTFFFYKREKRWNAKGYININSFVRSRRKDTTSHRPTFYERKIAIQHNKAITTIQFHLFSTWFTCISPYEVRNNYDSRNTKICVISTWLSDKNDYEW